MRIPALFTIPLLVVACGGSAPAPAASPAPTTPASASTSTASVERVDGAKAHDLVKGGAQLVDVRSADEYADKHIDGAINVPADAIASHDFGGKDKALVLYCTMGHRSEKAAEALRASGYTHVYLLGPMSAWGN
jgi:phage shock protein E